MLTQEELISAQPLADRTVVITRAREQAAEFASELERFGARVFECPTIVITEPESYALFDEALDNLFGYDWIVFSSVNSVNYFLRRLESTGHDPSEIDDLRVCAIGSATAESLAESHVHVDVVPQNFKAEGVFAALENFLGGKEHFSGLNFLIPRAAVARDYLPLALEKAGARADVVPVYRTVAAQNTDRRKLDALLAGGGVDCITFTSSSTVKNFAQLFDTTDLGQLLSGVTVACIGDVTAATASEHGLTADILPDESTVRALALSIASYFFTQSSRQ